MNTERPAHSFFASLAVLSASLVLSSSIFAQTPAAPSAPSLEQLRQLFQNPPAEARPMVRWWWFGTAVEKPEILRELQQMEADGIGGAELAFVYPEVLDDPATGLKNLPFLSPEMLDAVNYAQAEGHRLRLRIDVTLCSGWPYGGPAITLAEAAGRLRIAEVPVPANATSAAVPTLAAGESLLSASIANAVPRPAGERSGGRGHLDTVPPMDWDLASAAPLPISGNSATISPSSTARVALFFISSHTLQQVKRAAVGAEGYVLDPFSHDAVATHLKAVGEPLVKAFGATPPYAIFSDSLEAYGADWTPKLPEEFRKRRGYDLLPHLPELVAGGTPAAEKVRHDYGVTLTELVNENYLTQIDDWAKAHHTKFRSQTYGEPAVSFSSQRLVALPEGEGPQWRAFSTLRWATSANHVFGNNVTSGETFTWLHSPVFRATPLDMKAEADIDFIMGENQLIFHGWPYSPPASELKPGDPGWSLYAAAVFNDHNPWHPVMPAVTKYIARMSWLLRQGEPANQVAILLPTDDAWASFTPAHVTVTGAMQRLITPALMSAILSAGYNADFIDADAIDTKGFDTHQILVIPPTDRIPAETLRKIDVYVAQGGKAISVGRLPSLDPEGKPLPDVEQLTKSIALIAGVDQLSQALHDAVAPDLQLTADDASTRDQLGFIRRKLSNADIYFLANTSNQPLNATLKLGTNRKSGKIFDPETGKSLGSIDPANVVLHLAPYGSTAIVFDSDQLPASISEPKGGRWIEDESTGWSVTYTSLGTRTITDLPRDWSKDAATLHYSGEAVYTRDVMLRFEVVHRQRLLLHVNGGSAIPGTPNSPPEHGVEPGTTGVDGLPNPLVTHPGPGMHSWYDAPIREAALVFINGKEAGALWHPPYTLDVTGLLHGGANHIEIRVYNTALNAWSMFPAYDYKPLIQKYGDRFQMQDLDQVHPLPSGVLGPVELEGIWSLK
jgi:hypothetical protein